MKIEELKFDSAIDIVNFFTVDLEQRLFANNLVAVCEKMYKATNNVMSGILLEQSKKKYLNIDIDLVIKAIIITIKERVKDEDKIAKVRLLIEQNNAGKMKNFRFIIDFFSFIGLCPNSDKTFLYSSVLCETNKGKNHFALNIMGFSRAKIVELILDKDVMKILDKVSDMEKEETKILAFGKKIKEVAEDKKISLFKVLETKDFMGKI